MKETDSLILFTSTHQETFSYYAVYNLSLVRAFQHFVFVKKDRSLDTIRSSQNKENGTVYLLVSTHNCLTIQYQLSCCLTTFHKRLIT